MKVSAIAIERKEKRSYIEVTVYHDYFMRINKYNTIVGYGKV